MKHYPKKYKDLSRKPGNKIISAIGSSFGSVDDLAIKFRDFYKEAHLVLFNFIVKQIWLEQHFLYNGARRAGRSHNGYGPDWAFSYFMKNVVGISQKPLTNGIIFYAIPAYFKDFFPKFLEYNPFEEPEKFKYPYKHLTLDHLCFVYQCHNRIEMLEEAEKRYMNINDFMDWATNIAFCYNEEVDKQMYSIVRNAFIPYLKLNK